MNSAYLFNLLFALAALALVATEEVVETPAVFEEADLHVHFERAPARLTWAQIRNLYGLGAYSASLGSGSTIAIVMYGDYGSAAQDLATFSSQNGLPSCTVANGCVTAATPFGACTNLGTGPSTIQANVLQTVHAIAPGAKKLYVCAPSANQALQAIRYAAQRANHVVIPFGVAEYSGQAGTFDPYINQDGVSFFAAAGDNSNVQYPSTTTNVIAVGGTTVSGTSGSFTSTAWSKTGGGCSTYSIAAASQQSYSQYAAQGCNGRKSIPDIAMVADPQSVPSIYYNGNWIYPGGTAFAAAVAVGIAATTGEVWDDDFVYGGFIQFRDITSGTSLMLQAKTGMDKVSGLGEVSDLFGEFSASAYGGSYPGTTLQNGESMTFLVDNWLTSRNNRFQFTFFGNNMQVNEYSTGTVWRQAFPNTIRPQLIMQSDGNLVMYETLNASGGTVKTAIWQSGTAGVGKGPYYLILQCDGNLVIYDSKQLVLWATGTHLPSWPGNGFGQNM